MLYFLPLFTTGGISDHSTSGQKDVVSPDVAVYHVTSADCEDTESSDVHAKTKPDVPTRFVTPKLMKIGRNPSNCKDIGEQLNLSMHVTPQLGEESVKHVEAEPEYRELVRVTPPSGKDSAKDGETTPEHEANFGDAKDDKNDSTDANESFVDDFMKRTAPELDTPVADDAPSEPEDSSAERPDLPSKPARLRFWNKKPKSLSKLLHVNLSGSRRKNQDAIDPESPTSPGENSTSPAKTPGSGGLPSPTKPPRPSSPPVRNLQQAFGIPKVGDVKQDVRLMPEQAVEDNPDANPATHEIDVGSKAWSNPVVPNVKSTSELKTNESPESLRGEIPGLASLLFSKGSAELHNDDSDDERVILEVRDNDNAVKTKISIELGTNIEDANVTHVESDNEPTLHSELGVNEERSSSVNSDIASHEQEGGKLQGAVVLMQDELVEPVQSSGNRTDGSTEEPNVSPEKLPSVSTEEEDISIGGDRSPDNPSYKTPLVSSASTVHDNPDMSPKSPLRFFTPAGFTTGSPLKNKRLNYSEIPEIETSPKMEMKPDGKLSKEDVCALRFVTPDGFVPGSPEKDFGLAPLEAAKGVDVKMEQEDIPTEGREKEVSPLRVFIPGFVAKPASPKEGTVSVSANVTSDDIANDGNLEKADKPVDTNTKAISPLRFFTPPMFAAQQGHYGTVQLPDMLMGGKREVKPTQPGDDTLLKDIEHDRSTPSAVDSQGVVKQTYDSGDIESTNNGRDKGSTNSADMSNDHRELYKAIVGETGDSKDITRNDDANKSVSDDVATRLRFFTPAQFTPPHSHHDRISPVSSPTDPAGKISRALSPKDPHGKINIALSPKDPHGKINLALSPKDPHGKINLALSPKDPHGKIKLALSPSDSNGKINLALSPMEPSDNVCTETKEGSTEPTSDTSHDVRSETTSPSIPPSTASTPDEQHNQNRMNGNVTPDDRINEYTPSSPRLFTATKYSSPKSYHTVSPSPLANNMSRDETIALTHDSRTHDVVPASLPQNSPPPLPDCPPPHED